RPPLWSTGPGAVGARTAGWQSPIHSHLLVLAALVVRRDALHASPPAGWAASRGHCPLPAQPGRAARPSGDGASPPRGGSPARRGAAPCAVSSEGGITAARRQRKGSTRGTS